MNAQELLRKARARIIEENRAKPDDPIETKVGRYVAWKILYDATLWLEKRDGVSNYFEHRNRSASFPFYVSDFLD